MEHQAAIKLIQTSQWLYTELAQKLEPLDLTGQQLKILSILAISQEEKVMVNDIKAQMLTPMSNVSRLLNKLMEKALIVKVRDNEDQRKVYINITPLGKKSLAAGKVKMDSAFSALNQLTQDEQNQLIQLLNKIKL